MDGLALGIGTSVAGAVLGCGLAAVWKMFRADKLDEFQWLEGEFFAVGASSHDTVADVLRVANALREEFGPMPAATLVFDLTDGRESVQVRIARDTGRHRIWVESPPERIEPLLRVAIGMFARTWREGVPHE